LPIRLFLQMGLSRPDQLRIKSGIWTRGRMSSLEVSQ